MFAGLVAGKAPKQIAHANGISVSTVRGHIQGVLSKLDVSTQREALAMARDAGWPLPRWRREDPSRRDMFPTPGGDSGKNNQH